MGDGDEELGESGGVVIGAVGQEKIDIIGRDDAALRGFGDLDDGEQGVALTGVLVDDRQREVRTAGTEAGEVLDPVIGFARDDMKAGGGERLAVSEGGVRRDCAEERGGETAVGEQRIAFGEEHRAAAGEDLLGDGDERGDGRVVGWCGGEEAEGERAEPEEDPPGARGCALASSWTGVPKCGFRPRPE